MTETRQYRRPPEIPFLEEDRQTTTILFGTFTPKHEAFIRVVFRGAGYKCENLPAPTRRAHDTGKEFCNNGLCNPNYFTAGTLIEYLKDRVREGATPQEVVQKYLYFTAGGCGPCRFGMYEGEYRQALDNAGFKGFRVLTFDSSRTIHQDGSRHPDQCARDFASRGARGWQPDLELLAGCSIAAQAGRNLRRIS
jgi:hypothetical protein